MTLAFALLHRSCSTSSSQYKIYVIAINRSSTLKNAHNPMVFRYIKDSLSLRKFNFNMANNIYHNPNYNFPQRRNGGGVAAYLLGMGPMPPPQPQDIAVGMANHLLDHQAAGPGLDDDADENIDPQLQGQQPGLAVPAHNVAGKN